MKKYFIILSGLALLFLSACSLSQLHSSSVNETPSSEDISHNEYEHSEKTDYVDDYGSDVIHSVVSGNELVENPWLDVSDNSEETKHSKNNKHEFLMVPTWFDYFDGLYFFVDCYHDQIIFNDNLDDPLIEWKVMDDNLNQPHTIASDGEVYVVDDTEENKIVAYKKVVNEDGSIYFERIQEFVDMGERPHYTQYDEETKSFYSWSSKSGQMWVFKRSLDSTMIFLDRSFAIPALRDIYIRSFAMCDGKFYFVSGTGGESIILEADPETFDIVREIPVAPELGGMVQIRKIQDYYYVTVSTSVYGETECKDIVRTDSLDHLLCGQYESISDKILGEFPGTPYNISYVQGRYCVTIHREGLGAPVCWFEVENNEITNIGTYY